MVFVFADVIVIDETIAEITYKLESGEKHSNLKVLN